MSKLITKARAGVTLVELLVVILIVTILSVSLLPLLKPYIEQSKYAAEAQPTLANIQTKINLYQYEKDKLPSTMTIQNDNVLSETYQDDVGYSWALATGGEGEAAEGGGGTEGAARVYTPSIISGLRGGGDGQEETEGSLAYHLSKCVDVDWQDLMGRRMNPSHFKYHVIKGLGAASYGYALGVFGDGEGLAKGTGYAILVLVDTHAKIKVIATWERYKPVDDTTVSFKVGLDVPEEPNQYCYIPESTDLTIGETKKTTADYAQTLLFLKRAGWSFNSEDYAVETE